MSIVVFSGAGLSAESGLETFRTGASGLWNNHKIYDICNINTWQENRTLVHEFYNERRLKLSLVKPNQAHYALAAWKRGLGAKLLTQNVDNLLERAEHELYGDGENTTVHLHGELTRMKCVSCAKSWEIGVRTWDSTTEFCPHCFRMETVKPDPVFFREGAPEYTHMHGAISSLQPEDTVIVIGTSCEVIHFDRMLRYSPGYKIFNSLDPEGELGKRALKIFDLVLAMPATQAVQVIWEHIRPTKQTVIDQVKF